MSVQDETQVIGSVFHRPDLLLALDLLPEEFEAYVYRRVYEAVLEQQAASRPVDFILISDRLEREDNGESWIAIIGSAMQQTVSTANARHYADRVRAAHRARMARQIAANLLETCEEEGACDQAVKALMDLGKERRRHECSVAEACSEALDYLDELVNNGGKIRGVPTGLADIDRVLGGFHDSDLVVIGARPSMGKTALMLNLALGADASVGIITAEQPRLQMGSRLMSIVGGVNAKKLRNGDVEDHEWMKLTSAVATLHDKPIRFYDRSAPSIAEIAAQARSWKHAHDIRALYVDYLQRIRHTDARKPRHELVGEVVMALKELARDLAIPVIALAQVNREVEKRPDKRPGLADLKDSGTIEQEADVVAFLYRDEVYNSESEDVGLAEIEVAKNRHGPIGRRKVVWQCEYMRFEDFYGGWH